MDFDHGVAVQSYAAAGEGVGAAVAIVAGCISSTPAYDLEDLLKGVLSAMHPPDILKQEQQLVIKLLDCTLNDLYGPAAKCTQYGSTVCGLAGKDADIDLTFTPPCAGLHGYDRVDILRSQLATQFFS